MSIQLDQPPRIEKPPLFLHKMHFSLLKRVKYGQAVYVCGDIPELGCWLPDKAFRLKWTEDDVWTGSILLRNSLPHACEYKYIIADFEKPLPNSTVWQTGQHNRRTDIDSERTLTYLHDRWNMDKISLNIVVPKSKREQQERYYVSGDIHELGRWKERRPMKRIIKREISHENNIYEGLLADADVEILSFSFYAYRGRNSFSYSYLRRGQVIANERTPKRIFDLSDQQTAIPSRVDVLHPKGEIFVLDRCNVGELAFSQVTGDILVGSHLRTRADIQRLKAQGVTSVLALQTERDLKKHGFSPHYLRLLCEQNGLRYRRYSIEDMNSEDFIMKADGGVRLMHELLKEGGVYVYCSAGVYRSPQLVALYLALHQQYSLDEAISLVRKNHPYAKPNYKTVHAAMRLAKLKKFLRKIPL